MNTSLLAFSNSITYIRSGLLVLCMFFICGELNAIEDRKAPLVVNSESEHFVLGPYLSFLEDQHGHYSFEEAVGLYKNSAPEIQANYENVLNLGLSESSFWIFVDVDFSRDQITKQWLLELAFPLIEKVELFVLTQGAVKKHMSFSAGGEQTPDVSIKGSSLVFNLDLQTILKSISAAESNIDKKEHLQLVLKIDSFALNILPIHLWTSDSLAKHNSMYEYWLGFFFGLMAVIAFYNVIVYSLTKDKSYFYYLCYITSLTAFFGVYSGIAMPYFPDTMGLLNEKLPIISALLAMSFSLKFVSSFLGISKISTTLHALVNLACILLLVLALASFENPFAMINPTSLLIPVFVFFMLYIIFFARARGAKQANIVMLSFLVWMAAVLIFVASIFSILSVSPMTQSILYFGAVFQVIILSLALAGQINEERQKRYQALIRENQAVQDLRRMEERSLERAMLDPLTGLPNRAALERFSKDLLENKDGRREPLVVLFIHLQSYYDVSHTLGFRSSDLLIEKAAGRLNRIAAEVDDCLPMQVSNNSRYFVSKLDSASFVVMFRLRDEKQTYVSHAQHILELLNRPIAVHDMKLDVNAAIGMSFSPEHSTNLFTLVRFAQAALEAEVEQGNNKNVVALYSSVVSQQAARKLKLINDLRTAVRNNELYLVFQPQLDMREKKIVSIEALLRWRHPELGEVGPSEFIILAEQTGLIDELSQWVLINAIESLLWLMEKGLKLRLAVNISAKNLSQENFSEDLFGLLEKHRLDPRLISLELTETSLMNNPEQGINILKDIHQKGIAVAIDDFGAGYSSFAFIKQLPLSELKIDRSFVSQVDNLHSDRVITKSTIALAHEMGARVVAEGVESASCLQILSQFECDIAQGFHIAKPMSKEDLLVWLDESQFTS